MPLCLDCKGPLVAVGQDRKNGKDHADWDGRRYHKKCFKTLVWVRTYFYVPYDDNDAVKELGARFDRRIQKWYSPNNAVCRNLKQAGFIS